LVTGGAGFIGSNTVDVLLQRGYDVRILDLLQPRVHPKGRPAYIPTDVEFIEGDVASMDHIRTALTGCQFVLHLAAYQDYLPDFSHFIHTNTESTALLFELAVSDPRRFPVERIVIASSQAVSGEGKYRCRVERTVFYPGPRSLAQLRAADWDIACPNCGSASEPLLIDEETCNNPHTAYGISKYAAELLAFNLGRRHGISTAAMRYTYVQGPRNSLFNAYSGIARRFAMRIRAGLAPVCYEDGQQQRDYVHVADVASANVLVLESPVAEGIAYNVGGGTSTTVLEFARLMLTEAGSRLEPIVPGQFRVGDTRHTVSDLSRITALGWRPTRDVRVNIRDYLAWLDTQADSREYLIEAERVMEERGVVQRVQP
jgi:dTDP-L-rhamnose 4-epimerase